MDRIVEAGPGYRAQAPQFRWGAVFAGALVALGVWVLLYAFGLAVGLSSIDAANPRSVGIGTGVWSLVAPLIALFVGGVVASRVAGPTDRTVGVLHGAVLWGLTTVAGVMVVGSLLTALVGGLAGAGSKAVQGVGGSGALSGEDLVKPINERLQAQGKPTITAEQLQNSLKAMGTQALSPGSFDQQAFASALSQNSSLSEQDAREVAGQVQGQLSGAGQQLQAGAMKAADVSATAFWGIFAALALGLVSAILGAAAGVSQRQRIEAGAA